MIDDVGIQELRAFSEIAGSLRTIRAEDGSENAVAEQRYIRVYYGRKARSASFTGDRADYRADGTVDCVEPIARTLVERYHPDEPGFIYLRAYAAREHGEAQIATAKLRPVQVAALEPARPETSEEAYAAMSAALVETNTDLRHGLSDSMEALARMSTGMVDFAEKLGRFEAIEELGGAYQAHRMWADTVERLSPALLATIQTIGATAGPAAASGGSEPPKVDIGSPRPEDGEGRIDWDIAALQSVAMDIVQGHMSGRKLNVGQFNRLASLIDQVVPAMQSIKDDIQSSAG